MSHIHCICVCLCNMSMMQLDSFVVVHRFVVCCFAQCLAEMIDSLCAASHSAASLRGALCLRSSPHAGGRHHVSRSTVFGSSAWWPCALVNPHDTALLEHGLPRRSLAPSGGRTRSTTQYPSLERPSRSTTYSKLLASSRSSAVLEPGLERTTSEVAFVGTWPKPYSADDAKRSSQALGIFRQAHTLHTCCTNLDQGTE
jgi:hypothetical protein